MVVAGGPVDHNAVASPPEMFRIPPALFPLAPALRRILREPDAAQARQQVVGQWHSAPRSDHRIDPAVGTERGRFAVALPAPIVLAQRLGAEGAQAVVASAPITRQQLGAVPACVGLRPLQPFVGARAAYRGTHLRGTLPRMAVISTLSLPMAT